MTKEQLILLKDLIDLAIKEHSNNYSPHEKSSHVMKKIYIEKSQKIYQKLLATCGDDK